MERSKGCSKGYKPIFVSMFRTNEYGPNDVGVFWKMFEVMMHASGQNHTKQRNSPSLWLLPRCSGQGQAEMPDSFRHFRLLNEHVFDEISTCTSAAERCSKWSYASIEIQKDFVW